MLVIKKKKKKHLGSQSWLRQKRDFLKSGHYLLSIYGSDDGEKLRIKQFRCKYGVYPPRFLSWAADCEDVGSIPAAAAALLLCGDFAAR